jgi:hypothetical protein
MYMTEIPRIGREIVAPGGTVEKRDDERPDVRITATTPEVKMAIAGRQGHKNPSTKPNPKKRTRSKNGGTQGILEDQK